MSTSRIPGFSSLTLEQRRQMLARRSQLEEPALGQILDVGGLSAASADKIVENVLGIYALPFGVALNLTINGIERVAPMVVEEPSVIAAASNAAKMIRAGGGFQAEMLDTLTTAQVQLFDVPDPARATANIEAAADDLLRAAAAAVPRLLERGGGPREIEVRDLGGGLLVVHVYVDCVDAMGANLANTIAEALGGPISQLSGGELGLRILSNLADRRVVKVKCRVLEQDLSTSRHADVTPPNGGAVMTAIERACRFAEADPYRAATHNKGLMNGVDAVVLATGNDWRAIEAGAHAFAARTGRYRPLATWRKRGSELHGELEMPMALGTVGGTLGVQPAAQLALRLAGIERASELCQLAACVGLASNLAAVRALATEGIQRGHMSLHARSVAAISGAAGDEVERVATAIVRAREINVDAARKELARIRVGAGACTTAPASESA